MKAGAHLSGTYGVWEEPVIKKGSRLFGIFFVSRSVLSSDRKDLTESIRFDGHLPLAS